MTTASHGAKTIDCKKYGQSICDVTHRLSEERLLFMGGMGGAILKNLGKYKIQMFRKDTEVV